MAKRLSKIKLSARHTCKNIQWQIYHSTLQKHAYSNILNILPPKKKWKFSDKNSDSFHVSAQNIDCGYSRNKKNNVYPCEPQFYCIKVGFKGVKIISVCFRDEKHRLRTVSKNITGEVGVVGGGELKSVLRGTTLALSSVVIYTRHLFSPREGFLNCRKI